VAFYHIYSRWYILYEWKRISKSAVKENPELLRSNVKRVIGIIVGLLKDRVSVDSSPSSKRTRIEKIIKK
jgi:hypothetical protein